MSRPLLQYDEVDLRTTYHDQELIQIFIRDLEAQGWEVVDLKRERHNAKEYGGGFYRFVTLRKKEVFSS